jgi:cobalt-zinc-cadmium efflux system membrane fusion protein
MRVTKEVGGALVATPTLTIAFNVNRADLADLRVGQAVEIATLDGGFVGRSTVASIKAPFEDGSRATVMTVALPANASMWPIGTPLKGTVMIEELDASVAVRTLALQHFRNSKVVMAQFGDTYEVRMLEIGRQTPEWTEVKSGLKPGTHYVSQNVFVLGAKLDKNSPATVHGH